jgi:energy-coupling factor transporter ATP-binding protein EcfA2
MKELENLIAGLDVALMQAESVLDPDELAAPARIADRLKRRRGFPGDAFVVALCGGTGSGKSSLLNALAGEEVASVSAVRPHTETPMAWVPRGAGHEMLELLDEIGIDNRVEHERLPDIAVLDLPDQDSIEPAHRMAVQRLLPQVDAVAWVFDPVKYADRTIHDDFIAPLADHDQRFMFVLNKVDTLADPDIPAVGTALVEKLRGDGVRVDRYFAVAADPNGASPLGVDDLVAHLNERLDAKKVLTGKRLTDLRQAVRAIARRARLYRGGEVGFDLRWQEVQDALVEELVDRDRRAALDDTLCQLEDFVAGVSAETGGTFGRRVVDAFPPERLEAEMRQAAGLGSDSAETGSEPSEESIVAGEMYRRIGKPLRELFWDRATLGAYLASLSVETLQAEAKLRA